MPAEVIARHAARYVEAYELLTGARFDDWYGTGRVERDHG